MRNRSFQTWQSGPAKVADFPAVQVEGVGGGVGLPQLIWQLARHGGGETQLNLLDFMQQVPKGWVGQSVSQPCMWARAGRLLRASQKPAATESKLF